MLFQSGGVGAGGRAAAAAPRPRDAARRGAARAGGVAGGGHGVADFAQQPADGTRAVPAR